MKSPRDKSLSSIATRASYDNDMRTMLRQMGIDPSGAHQDVMQRLNSLDVDGLTELQDANAELERRTGRSSVLYEELAECAQDKWRELMEPNVKRAMEAQAKDLAVAREALKGNDRERFEAAHERLVGLSNELTEAVRDGRNEVRHDLRQVISESGVDLPIENRQMLVDQISNRLSMPKDVAAVMAAPTQLEEARAELVRKRELANSFTPRVPSPSR